MSETKNKIRYGLQDVHVGKVTIGEGGTVTFSEPKAYPGAVHITMNPEGESTPVYADNVVYYMSNSNNGYTGDVEFMELHDWFEKEFLGAKESTDGMIVEIADAVPEYMYLMFRFEGDVKATKHILYYVQASRPNIEGQTKEGSIAPTTTTVPYTAIPLPGTNIVKAKVPSSATNYEKFFETAPTIPSFAAAAANTEGA